MAGVADPQHHLAEIGQRGRYDDLAAGIGEMDRIADQVQCDLAQRPRVRDHGRQHVRERRADDDALAIGLRLQHRNAALDQFVEVLVGESQIELAGFDSTEVKQVVDDGDHAFAGGADVLHVFEVALVAERAEPLADHHFGKADDGVQRRPHLVADPGQHVGFGIGGAFGQPPRLAQFALGLFGLRKIAEHREEIWAFRAGAAHGHRQRDDAALAFAAQHLAAVIEQAGDAGSLDAGEIFEHAMLAFGREQIGEIAPREFVAVMAEQRFGAAVGRMDVALGVEHQNAFGRGVEDGGKVFGIGMPDVRRFGDVRLRYLRYLRFGAVRLRYRRFEDVRLRCRLGSRDGGRDRCALMARAREDQGQRLIAVP